MIRFYKGILLLLSGFCSLSAHATNYYIANSGHDTASGMSPATAWRSASKIYTVTFIAGDSLLLKAGDTISAFIYLSPAEYGTPTRPIVISSYGGGKATIAAGANDGIFLYNNAGINICNLNITGAGDSINTGQGIYIYLDTPGSTKLNSIAIDSVDISGFHFSGIYIYSYPSDSSRTGINNISITHSAIHDNGGTGIALFARYITTDTLYNFHNVYIGHCTVYNNSGGSGIEISETDSAVIEYCEAYNNGATAGGVVGIWAWDANKVTIQHCESHHNHTIGSDGDGFDLDGGVTNSTMQYNYSHNNDGAGYLVWQFNGARPYRNNVVRFNISENDSRTHSGYYGMVAIGAGDSTVNSGVHDVLIYNNTFFKDPIPGNDSMQGPAISLSGDEITGIKVYNNIFMLDSTTRFIYLYNHAGIQFLNNDYWSNKGFWVTDETGSYTSLDSWAAATGQEISGVTIAAHTEDPLLADPGRAGTIGNSDSLDKLINYYKLLSSSPMLDSGINLMSIYGISTGPTDFFGTALPLTAAYDIGAYYKTPALNIASKPFTSQYQLFPDPCHDQLTILDEGVSNNSQVYLYGLQGKCVYAGKFNRTCKIDMSEFVPGIYTLIILSNGIYSYTSVVHY